MISFGYNYQTLKRHAIHPYPAKFPASIPYQIINEYLSPSSSKVIFDPFSGCGTTLLEGINCGHHVIGNDTNHIGNLITRVKTENYTPLSFKRMDKVCEQLMNKLDRNKIRITRNFHGRDHWFQKNVQQEVSLIINEISKIKDNKICDLLKVCLSNILIDISNQESDTRYAAIDKKIKNKVTIKKFITKYFEIKDIILNEVLPNKNKRSIFNQDIMKLNVVKDNSVDIIITSPPYANTYDYYLYHKHRMNWLDYDYTSCQSSEIGSRNQYSSKKDKVDVWMSDIKKFLIILSSKLRSKSIMSLIIGDSVINKQLFDVSQYIKNIQKEVSMSHISTISESMKKNSRKFNHKFRSNLDKKEHIIILQRK